MKWLWRKEGSWVSPESRTSKEAVVLEKKDHGSRADSPSSVVYLMYSLLYFSSLFMNVYVLLSKRNVENISYDRCV